ncbi:Uncharacterized protein conserved in bacteria [Neisseria zoodegmatis]|uniref:Uncharacterized protein conserved in bacteria n=1 Tax=Neisseria zoodegmatis TaxID=326523 RepID=A0A378WE75_9NEIS|nr:MULTISPECIES: lysozyme inhibitor LprI family protein [Neisseria]SUA35720.1 Uncharacterized protein conserved in bacteria [Neisseria zoodegmatis]
MIVFKKKTISFIFFIFVLVVPASAFPIEPEKIISETSLNNPCFSGSTEQDDLIQCAAKKYFSEQKKLNYYYRVAIQQKNIQIRSYLIKNQKKWNKTKFRECSKLLDSNGREAMIEYISCTSNAIEDRNEFLNLIFVCEEKSMRKPCDFKDETKFFEKAKNF